MSHDITFGRPRPSFATRLALVVRLVLLAAVAFSLSSAIAAAGTSAPPVVAADQGPCGANPCGPVPADQGPCGANPCGDVPGNQGPCGANPCGDVPASQGPCGANPCGAAPDANPNTGGQPAAANAASSTTAPGPAPSAPANQAPGESPTTTAGGFQDGQAAPGFKVSTGEDGSAAAWAIPVGLVVLVAALFFWLARRNRTRHDPLS
ncbi:MAG: hypothetical protein M3137_11795 [Actinomycetota bacterium]|nr:hypothetical protein [Actinomycetota bacterium]